MPSTRTAFDRFLGKHLRDPKGGNIRNHVQSAFIDSSQAAARGEISSEEFAQGLIFGMHRGSTNAAELALNRREGLAGASLAEADRIARIEDERFGEQSEFLGDEFATSNEGFASDVERLERLMMSRAADIAGGEARTGMANLRSSLGARGINVNSGLAAGMASDIALRQSGQLMGARANIGIEGLRARSVQRNERMRQANVLAAFRSQGPSTVRANALGALHDSSAGDLADREARHDAEVAGKRNRIFGFLGAGVQTAIGRL